VGVHVHVAEAVNDADAGRRLEGRARPSWLLAHATHLDRPLPGTIAHNPRSNLNNAVGYARPTRFATWGNRVVLGTDGIGADMLEEQRLAFAVHRADDLTATPDVSWSWLEAGAALVPEVVHDRVRWDAASVDPWHLAYTTGVRVERVEVGGEVVVDEGRATKVDRDEVRAKAREQARRLFRRMEELP
jgi:cytosine/adenosine deaminase-related metal-dependent hydrolase